MNNFYPYKIYNCDNRDFFKNDKLVSNLDKIFLYLKNKSSPLNLETYICGTGQVPVSKPSHNFGLPALDAFKIPGVKNLADWINECLLDASVNLFHEPADKIRILRNWINFSYLGNGRHDCHAHIIEEYPNSHVAIFYQSAPSDNSCQFGFVKNVTSNQKLKDVKEEDRHMIDITEGMLIVHHNNAWHGTEVHSSTEPKIAMIFDFIYESN